jgi:hypothetical protein
VAPGQHRGVLQKPSAVASSGSTPIRSRTQEAQPSAQAYTQQHRRRFTSAVPNSGGHDISTSAASAAPAYRLIKNPVWQPQPAAPTYVLQAQPPAAEAYIVQQQYQQPAEPIEHGAQQGSKRPRLTAEPEMAEPPYNAPASAAPPAVSAAQPEQHQQQLQQQPDLQQQLQALPTTAQSRFEQLCQLAAMSPEASFCDQGADATAHLPNTVTLMPPAQADDMRHLAAVRQSDISPTLPAAEAVAAVPAADPSQSTSQERVQQPSVTSAQGAMTTSRCMLL